MLKVVIWGLARGLANFKPRNSSSILQRKQGRHLPQAYHTYWACTGPERDHWGRFPQTGLRPDILENARQNNGALRRPLGRRKPWCLQEFKLCKGMVGLALNTSVKPWRARGEPMSRPKLSRERTAKLETTLPPPTRSTPPTPSSFYVSVQWYKSWATPETVPGPFKSFLGGNLYGTKRPQQRRAEWNSPPNPHQCCAPR